MAAQHCRRRSYTCASRVTVQLRLMAANGAYSGEMGGVSGADHACYRQAREVGMRSTFRAFIAGRVQDLYSLIHRQRDRSLPVVNAKVIDVLTCFFLCGLDCSLLGAIAMH